MFNGHPDPLERLCLWETHEGLYSLLWLYENVLFLVFF